MYKHEVKMRVRYAETDQMGYVYYGNYATYFEVARVEALRSLGFRYRNLEEQGILMPVRELNTRFIQPAKYDDLLTIKVSIREMPDVKIIFDYEVFNEEGAKLSTGNTTLVFVNNKTNKLVRCPRPLAILLENYYG